LKRAGKKVVVLLLLLSHSDSKGGLTVYVLVIPSSPALLFHLSFTSSLPTLVCTVNRLSVWTVTCHSRSFFVSRYRQRCRAQFALMRTGILIQMVSTTAIYKKLTLILCRLLGEGN